jgi:uncharacterized protein (TIGR02246 family)
LESLLDLYDPEAVFLNASGEVLKGTDGLRKALAPLATSHASFSYKIRQIVQTDNIALMHTDWQVTLLNQNSTHAIEVARRQADGSWRWLIGDPFTVGKRVQAEPAKPSQSIRVARQE